MKVSIISTLGAAEPTEIEIEPSQTIREVVENAAQTQALNANEISLAKGGRVLELDRTVKESGIKAGDTLKVLPKNPVGGAWPTFFATSPMTTRRIGNEKLRINQERLPLRQTGPLAFEGQLRGRGKWAHQSFRIRIDLPRNYPARPPLVRFLTRPNPPHPNVSPTGYVCLNHLLGNWSPTNNLATVWDELAWLLEHPNYMHGFVPDGYVRGYHTPGWP